MTERRQTQEATMLRKAYAAVAMLLLVAPALAPVSGAVSAPSLDQILGLIPQSILDKIPAQVPLIIPDTIVGPGTTRTYESRNYTMAGTITVQNGGTLVMNAAHFEVTQASKGVVVQAGGTLRMTGIVLESTVGATVNALPFAIDVQLGAANATITDSTIRGGGGVHLASSNATVTRDLFEKNSLGLMLDNITIVLDRNTFRDNTVGMNQTGGRSRISNNTFVNGTYGMRDWQTDPTVENNTMRGVHFGIWHEHSATRFTFNDLMDSFDPGGIGIALIGQIDASAVHVNVITPTLIHNNTIAKFGTGILVRDAVATIYDNDINESVSDGIAVENNTGETRVENNTVRDGAGNGVRVYGTHVPIVNDTITNNSAAGILLQGGTLGEITDVTARANGDQGVLALTPNATITRGVFEANGIGIRLEPAAADASINNAIVNHSVGAGIDARAARAHIANVTVSDNSGSGVLAGAAGMRLRDSTLLSNNNGFEADGARDLQVNNTGIQSSSSDGVYYHDSDDATFDHVNASANGGDGFHIIAGSGDVVSITCSRAISNGANGLNADGASTTSATNSWFESNGGFGVLWTGAGTLSATPNYWGAASGPTTTSNPGGTGDEVSNGVTYSPFLTAPPTC